MVKFKTLFFLSLLTFFLFSCDRPACENTHPILSKADILSKEYNEALVLELNREENKHPRFWFKSLEKVYGQDYMVVDVQADELCAEMLLKIVNWDKLEGIKRAQGESYHGAQLKGLKYKIERNDQELEFVLESIDTIID